MAIKTPYITADGIVEIYLDDLQQLEAELGKLLNKK